MTPRLKAETTSLSMFSTELSKEQLDSFQTLLSKCPAFLFCGKKNWKRSQIGMQRKHTERAHCEIHDIVFFVIF